MTGLRFVDTNVLVYAATGRTTAPKKQIRAEQLISSEPIGLSVQVLQEFYVTTTRDKDHGLSPQQGGLWVERLGRFPVAELDARWFAPPSLFPSASSSPIGTRRSWPRPTGSALTSSTRKTSTTARRTGRCAWSIPF